MFFKYALITVLVLFLNQGDALKCYECDSQANPQCKDNVTSLEMTNCLFSNHRFYKPFCQTAVFEIEKKEYTMRMCGKYIFDSYLFCKFLKKIYKVVSCDVCETNGCNGLPTTAPKVVTLSSQNVETYTPPDQSSNALKCYVCNALDNPQCENDVTTLGMTECRSGDTSCVKYVLQEGAKEILFRACGNNTLDYCDKLKSNFADKYMSCDSCDTDGCNGLSAITPLHVTLSNP